MISPSQQTALIVAEPGYTSQFFAGFFDADGAVGIARGEGTSYFLLTCQITQVDRRILDLFKERYRGKVTGPYLPRQPNRRPMYAWRADARIAESFLHDVLPWLVVKRERAEIALEFRKLFTKGLPRGRNLAGELKVRVLAEREVFYDRLKILNKRGAA